MLIGILCEVVNTVTTDAWMISGYQDGPRDSTGPKYPKLFQFQMVIFYNILRYAG